ncbi:hypothetical protein OAA86_08470 [Rhodospirillales bacterium]|nr:hypothetical protein [Rhodospirillales bacterium]
MSDLSQFKLRIKNDLRIRLEAAADIRKVSANFEAVQRLEDSFLKQDRMFGTDATMSMIKTFAAVVNAVEDHNGAKWNEDEATRSTVNMALLGLIGIDGKIIARNDKYLREHRKQIAQNLIMAALKFGGYDADITAKVEQLTSGDK